MIGKERTQAVNMYTNRWRGTKWDLPVASAIFVTHPLTFSTAHTFVGIVGTSTMLAVGVVAPASSIEITIVAVFDCWSEVKPAILSSVVIAAKAFVTASHAWVILTGAPVEAWGRPTSIDWELTFVSAPIPITLTFVSLLGGSFSQLPFKHGLDLQ